MTRFVESKDGCRIAYDKKGNGSALLLIHGGFTQSRRVWTELSYVQELQQQYTVITVDIRGHGESDKPKVKQAYAVERLLEDIDAVAEDAKVNRYFVWGFSLGASICLHTAVNRELLGGIAAASFFGQDLIEYGKRNIPSLEAAVEAQAQNQLDLSTLSAEERFFVDNADLEIALAISKAMADWPRIEPTMLRSPLLVYAGTSDEPTYSILKRQSDDIKSSGAKLCFIDGLDHFQAVTEKKIVLPVVQEFLAYT